MVMMKNDGNWRNADNVIFFFNVNNNDKKNRENAIRKLVDDNDTHNDDKNSNCHADNRDNRDNNYVKKGDAKPLTLKMNKWIK